MKKIGFLVSENYQENIKRVSSFREEFQLLAPYFEKQGVLLERLVWSAEVDFSAYATLIPKAVWDYFDRPDDFRRFLDRLQAANQPMTNPLSVVRWNMDKSYLADIREKGLAILDFHIYPQGSSVDLQSDLPFPNSTELLIKPSIGGGSKDTVVTPRSSAAEFQGLANKILGECSLMIQPFYKEVAEGEYSFFFFGGEFSHAIIKIPAKGDFRAHSFFKAKNSTYQPTNSEIEEVQQFLHCAPEACAYARIDLIKVEGRHHLVELELFEPYLYLEYAPDTDVAAEQFATAIISAPTI